MTELMSDGVELMLVGMGIVFLFLAMLVIAIHMMSWLIQRFFPGTPTSTIPLSPLIASGPDKSTVAAITAAVHQYRSRHK
jgi:oxaloacetate decarboxylase gamma subunit